MKFFDGDPIKSWFGLNLMDELHDYPGATSNIRYYHRLKARYINNFILKNKGKERLLDAGAGRGPYCVIASPFYKEVYCDEFEAKELDHAKSYTQEQSLQNIICVNSDLTQTNYQDNFFDCIICSEVLEHIPMREKAVKELTRILKPNGRLLISMPQRRSLFYQRSIYKYKHLQGIKDLPLTDPDWELFQHFKFTSKDIRNLVTASGLKIVTVGGVNVLPLNQMMFKLLYSFPPFFYLYCVIESALERMLPFFGSFYFVELTKK